MIRHTAATRVTEIWRTFPSIFLSILDFSLLTLSLAVK